MNQFGSVFLGNNQKRISTNIAFKLYYSHFLEKKFDLNILLPDTCFNPISNNIKKISKDYILSGYSCKLNNKDIISIKNIYLDKKKEEIYQFLKSCLDDIKNDKISDQYERILQESFIDKNSNKQINKLLKILRI